LQTARGSNQLKYVSGFSPGCKAQPLPAAAYSTIPGGKGSKFQAAAPPSSRDEESLSFVSYENTRGKSSNASPILLCHALLGRKENWSRTGRELTHLTSRDLIIPDARNHGNSPKGYEMTNKQMSEDIVQLLESLKVPRVSIVGHGIGGRIGMYTALVRPDLVEKLVVVSSSPINDERELDRLNKIREACYVIQTVTSNKSINEAMLTSMEFQLEADDALQNVIKDSKERALFISNLGRVNHNAILGNPDLWKFPDMESHCFNKPVLFLTGEREPTWSDDTNIRKIRQTFPNAQFVKLENAGYFPHLDAHEQFLEAVASFLETDHDLD